MLYVLMFVTLWTICFIIWRNARGAGYVHWIALIFLTGGCASFSVSIHHVILPYLRQNTELPSPVLETLRIIGISAIHIYFHFIFYTFLMSAVLVCRLFAKRLIVWIGLAALAVPLWSLVSTGGYYPTAVVDVQSIRTWSLIYFAAGVACYVAGYMKESDAQLRRNLVRTGALIIIPLVLAFITDFYSVAAITINESDIVFTGGNHWDINSLIVLWLLVSFVLFALRYGVFGVKLKIEQQKLDYSIRALTKGTAILNHALKNEVVKINLIGEHIQYLLNNDDQAAAKETATHLFEITDRMTALFRKIGEQTEEIVLNKERIRINGLIDSIAAQLRPLAESKGVTIRCAYQDDIEVSCDPHHIAEVLNNVCLNAMDAMPSGGGTIDIHTNVRGSRLNITVKDNGKGIPQEMMGHVFTPFFTTKSGQSVHSGLGLSYCYNVLQKHGGVIKVLATEPGKGTTIGLVLPLKD
ncbi:sensor histidine kinase [Paenibacillus hamazuiensis]|uniref:sensor histidine kinase n=1 Tax=Paenibacillus hamazuiensis TaxID=2936508 RepID=UPI00200DDCFA|nr:HAMP domain-containing sensor histidine kinase [Paenibacillus hamazuiensis]